MLWAVVWCWMQKVWFPFLTTLSVSNHSKLKQCRQPPSWFFIWHLIQNCFIVKSILLSLSCPTNGNGKRNGCGYKGAIWDVSIFHILKDWRFQHIYLTSKSLKVYNCSTFTIYIQSFFPQCCFLLLTRSNYQHLKTTKSHGFLVVL